MSSTMRDGEFIGTLRESRKVGGLTLAETTYQPGLVVPAHAHDHSLISVVLEGGMTEEHGRRKTPCESGTLIFQPSEEPHSHKFPETGGRCFTVQFGAPWIERVQVYGIRQPDHPLALRRSKANWLAGQLYREFRSPDSAAALAIEGFALAMLGEITRAKQRRARGAKPGWLIRLVELLHARLQETLSMTELAAEVGVHPTHLTRTFRDHYGCTPGEYLRKLRIEFAQRKLTSTSKSLSEIALTAGFADQAHFSRIFKQLTGQTPGAYRRAAAG